MDASNNAMSGESFPSSVPSAPPPFPQSAVPQPPVFSAPAGLGAQATEYTQYQMVAQTQAASRRRVAPILFAVGVLVALIVAAIGGVVAINATRTPEAEVRQYLEYLAQGKAGAATAMVDPGVPKSERVFLTDEVMASATSLMEVEDVVDRNEGSTSKKHTVNATLLVDGTRFTFPFEVREAKPTLGIIKNWKIESPLVVPVAVRIKDVSTFSVGGVTAPVSDYNSFPFTSPTYMFYPGVYVVNAADLGDYFEAEPATLRASRDEYQYGGDPLRNVTIETEYSQSLLAAAVDVMAEQTNTCATPPGNLETVCPIGLQRTDLTVLEVKQMPTEAKQDTFGSAEMTEFHDYAFFKVQRGAGTPIYTLKSTVYATLKFDEKGKVVVDSSGKPQFWLRYEEE